MRKIALSILFFIIILVSCCVGRTEMTPVKTVSFELSPPISNELVSLMGWDNSDMKSVLTNLNEPTSVGGINRWSVAVNSNNSYNALILTEANYSVLSEVRQNFQNRANVTGHVDDTYPNIFYNEPFENIITLFCDKFIISAFLDEVFFQQVLAGLKKYNCSSDFSFTSINLEVPDFSIFNQELINYMKNKGYNLSSSVFVEVEGHEKVSFGFSSNSSSIKITQIKESHENYTRTLQSENRMANVENLVKNESFKNGNYWMFNHSGDIERKTHASKATWYCYYLGLTIDIESRAYNSVMPLSSSEIKELSVFIC